MEAMSWVSDERGLGGARSLDGLPWDLPIDQLWERWLGALMQSLAPRFGFGVRVGDRTERRLVWRGDVRSMRSLRPDIELVSAQRTVWIDAKYKHHLGTLSRKRWIDLSDEVRASHRADLHQALAYASLSGVDEVDTILAYPTAGSPEARTPMAVATLRSGPRRVRLFLMGVPFGFRGAAHEAQVTEEWGTVLRA